MQRSRDLDILWRGLRAAGSGKMRLLAATGILFSALVVSLLLVLFPGDPERISESRHFTLFLVSAGVLLWAIWSLVGGALLRGTILEVAGRPVPAGALLSGAQSRWSSHFAAPLFPLVVVALLLLLDLGLIQSARIPAVGWPLLVLLSPVVMLLAAAAVWLLVRWLLAAHLVGAAVAGEGMGAFGALGTALAYVRRAPVRVILLRFLALGLALVQAVVLVALAAAAVGAVYLLLPELPAWPPWPVADLATGSVLLLVALLAVWLASAPVALFFGARAALYLVHRRALDGVAVAAEAPESREEKTLEELGVELVQRLEDEDAAEEE